MVSTSGKGKFASLEVMKSIVKNYSSEIKTQAKPFGLTSLLMSVKAEASSGMLPLGDVKTAQKRGSTRNALAKNST